MPPSKTFLVQGRRAMVQDMQHSRRVRFTEVTCGIESHFPPPALLQQAGGAKVSTRGTYLKMSSEKKAEIGE